MIYRLIVVDPDRLAAAIAALLLVVLPTVFWSQAIVIEVYGLNALLVVVALWLLVRLLVEARSQNSEAVDHDRFDAGPGVIASLRQRHSAGAAGADVDHHAAPLVWKAWLIAAGCFLLGLTPWL